jgi:glucose/arabinose dehydrogenase
MREVFKQTILVSGPLTSPAGNRLFDPWEITYGPDDSLWVTEAKGYKVKKIHPVNAGQRTILNLSDAGSGGVFTPSSWRRQFGSGQNPWPQGGMMGLAIHPDFNHPVTPKKYVYIAYVHDYIGQDINNPNNGEFVDGHLFITRLVRFTYSSGMLDNPVSLCDTITGSNDHNSGRIIIAPVSGTDYLFYAVGDMGAGQFANLSRTNKAQNLNSYEGKILRFNLEPDGDPDAYEQWVPDSNPFNATLGVQSAVWSSGMRNNQGFAYHSVLNKLYGASHGPFSDDELNIIESAKNYGHPRVIGYSADGNYNNAKAGPSGSSLPLIVSESANAASIGASYKDALYSFYNPPAGNTSTLWSIQYIYTNQNYTSSDGPAPWGLAQNVNIWWESEAVSGIDTYSGSLIPGWKNSLLSACLKGGRIMRTKLNASGDAIVPTAGGDTVTYFRSVNRFRDMAVSPDGKDIFAVIDSSSVTSGPTTDNPVISACRGCLQKYTFLGYNDNSGASEISTTIPLAPGINDNLTNGTSVTIDDDNNNLWVPITDSLGNIIAEIDANGNNLGTITSTFYKNTGTIRTTGTGKPYLDRSITINVQTQPASAVNVRLYLTASELAALVAAPGSGVSGINDINVFKNTDPNSITLTATATYTAPVSRTVFGSGYVIKASINSFSSFYFAGGTSILPLKLISFTGIYNNGIARLQWETESEYSTDYFTVERNTSNGVFEAVINIPANGNTSSRSVYNYNDASAGSFAAPVIYYRLKMADKDGRITYSSVIALGKANIITKVSVMPNPAKDEAILSVTAGTTDEKAQWQLIDNTGRVIIRKGFILKQGTTAITVDLKTVPAGVYYIKVSGTAVNETEKLQKL